MTRDEILELLDEPIRCAAVGAALELGLLWRLAEQPLGVARIADANGIPVGRCRAWLGVLADAGLVEEGPAGFGPTAGARAAILDTYSPNTWRMLAQEARERLALVVELPSRLAAAAPPASGPAAYVQAMTHDPDRADRFTRMLFEVHQDLAASVADSLDLSGIRRMLDLGGGSGVVAMALARRWPELRVEVLDIPNVCAVGRRLVKHASLEDRVTFRGADVLGGELPSGADAVLECDVALYSEQLFGRVREALVPGGTFTVVDEFAEPDAPGSGGEPGSSGAAWALVRTLSDPDWKAPTAASVRELMARAGFFAIAERGLAPSPGVGGLQARATIIEGWAPRA